MKSLVAATIMAAALLLAASTLGVAAAEAPTGTSAATPTVSVEGVSSVAIAQEANAAAANAAYRQAMAAAVADGHGKAEFLAGQAGATLAAVQSIAEEGGSVECHAADASYVEYLGEQPDFGYTTRSEVVAPEAASTAAPGTTKKPVRKKRKKRKAKAATAAGCTVSAQVALAYALS